MPKPVALTKAEIPSVQEYPDLDTPDFKEMVKKYRELTDIQSDVESKKKELGGQIEAMLVAVDAKKVRYGNMYAERVESHGPSMISAQRLVEAGVDADVVVACTVEGRAYSYVQVRYIKSEMNNDYQQ